MDNSSPERAGSPDGGGVQGHASKFEYVKDGLPVTEYVKAKPPRSPFDVSTEQYHATATIVMCSCPGCRTIGTLEFPNGYDFKSGDRVVSKKTIKGMCLNCRTAKPHAVLDAHGQIVGYKPCIGPEVEFIPYGDSCDLLRRSQKLVKHIMGIS
jgi:hypothetical protein